jgi:hypothetical protein
MCNCSTKGNQMTSADMTKIAIAGGILFAAYKWGNGMIKAGAIAVAAGIVAKRVPYVQDVM